MPLGFPLRESSVELNSYLIKQVLLFTVVVPIKSTYKLCHFNKLMDVPLTGTGISLISVIWTVKAKKKNPSEM